MAPLRGIGRAGQLRIQSCTDIVTVAANMRKASKRFNGESRDGILIGLERFWGLLEIVQELQSRRCVWVEAEGQTKEVGRIYFGRGWELDVLCRVRGWQEPFTSWPTTRSPDLCVRDRMDGATAR